jgi:hypothetical protein
MNRTAQSLADQNPSARQDAGQAAEALQKLDNSLEEQQLRDRLADAYRLRKILERQISALGQCQKNGLSQEQGARLAQQVMQATTQLKQIGEGAGTRDYFGKKLRESLREENMQQMGAQCARIVQSGDSSGQKVAAGELAQQLQQVVEAFDASCPGGRQRQGNRSQGLMAEGQDALAQGLRQLESAARNQAGRRALSTRDRDRLAREARTNLGIGITGLYGSNERSEHVINHVDEMLKQPAEHIDMKIVQELLNQLQQLSRDSRAVDRPSEEPAKTTNVDLSRLPPDYREAIEKYFERLSEQ